MKFTLIEDNENNLTHLYKDKITGNIYASINGSLILIKKGTKKPLTIGQPDTDEDKAQLEKEAEERNKENVVQRTEEEEQERLKEIQRIFDDDETMSELERETSSKVIDSRRKKAEKQRNKERQVASANVSGYEKFKQSIKNFIANEVKQKQITKQTYSRINKKYANSGILVKGKKNVVLPRGKKPLINVYFDQSGSWGPSDIEKGKDAIAILDKFVKDDLIDINLYYFANIVGITPDSDDIGRGTYGTPIINHIKETNPDNVVILTDDDITDIKTPITIKGGLWILWKYGKVSENLKNNIHGLKKNEYFSIQ